MAIRPTDAPDGRSTRRTGRTLDRSNGANQDDAKSADLDVIFAQYRQTGTFPRFAVLPLLYGNFSLPEDIHSVRERIAAGEEAFNSLPAAVRKVAGNDWTTLLEMVQTREGRDELVAAGMVFTDEDLAPVPPAPAPAPDTVTPPQPPTSDPES